MKKLPIIAIAFFIVSAMVFSCKKSDNSLLPTPTTDSLSAIITDGIWKISSFTQQSEDNTSKFNDYTFVFTKDGKINAIAKNNTTTGTWSNGGTTYYGVNANKNQYTINLGNSEPLRRLSHNWVLSDKSQNSIQLSSSEPTENEHVTFTKQ